MSETRFASAVLANVIGLALGVKEVLDRPAEYYLQKADIGPSPKEGIMGVEVRLSGASRDGRTAKQFHDAIKYLFKIVKDTVSDALEPGQKCQVFCVIMLDGEVETAPGSGKYSNNVESQADWVCSQ